MERIRYCLVEQLKYDLIENICVLAVISLEIK